jgi:hypothetical protein
MKKNLILILVLIYPLTGFALNKTGRLGVGMNNMLANDLTALSVKIQQNRTFGLGAMLGFDSNSETTTTYGAGLRVYRILYDEPNLDFYMAGTVATLSYEEEEKAKSGYQLDGTFGAEFHFPSLESIGFSFEFGASYNKSQSGQHFQTVGFNMLRAGVHFYL